MSFFLHAKNVLFFFLFFSQISFQKTLEAFPQEPASTNGLLSTIRHNLNNHELEIASLKEKVRNQDATLESMREEVSSLIKSTKEAQKNALQSNDVHLKNVEKNVEKLVQDLKKFKIHSNDLADTISDLQKKYGGLQEIVTLQSDQIKDLEAALRSLVEAMQAPASKDKSSLPSINPNSYRVKSGDTLEKIAKAHGISVDSLKDANQLDSDKIVVDQKLIIPK